MNPRAVLVRRRDHARLIAELPEALDRLAAGLRSGDSLAGGLRHWATAAGPLAEDTRRVLRRAEDGETLAQSLAGWSEDRPLPEVKVTAAALQIALTVGGRSASALEGLAAAFRDAADLRSEVRAQSAQARLSALVIGLAPAGAVVLTVVLDPRVPATLVGTAPGRACLVSGLTLMVLASAWMARILRVTG